MKKFVYSLLAISMIAALSMTTGCIGRKDKTDTPIVEEHVDSNCFIKYANVKPTANSDMLESGLGPWMGVYVGLQTTAPANWNEYNWYYIKGEDGKDGVDGKDGKDAATPTDGKDGKDGKNGLSAYEIWSALPGNASKTEVEFLNSLKGATGTSGLNGQNGKDGINACNAHLTEILSYDNYAVVNGLVDNTGDYLLLIRFYCSVGSTTPSNISVARTKCTNSYACPNYYIVSGDISVPNSTVIIDVPIIAVNDFEKGNDFSVRLNGLRVNFATIEQAVY